MTRYEELKNKADACRLTAAKVQGFMRWVWLEHARKLESLAASLPLNRANQIIKQRRQRTMERIKAYFEEQIKTDPALAEAYKEEKLNKCWQYIMSQAKKEAKNNCAMIEEAQVYKWARDFMLGDVPEAKEEIQTGAPAEDNNSVTSEAETIEEGTAEEVAAEEPAEVSEKAPVINGKEIAEGTYEITPDLHFNDVPKNEKLVIEKVEEEPAEVMQPVIQKEKKSKKADEYDGPSLFDFDDLF